MVSAAALALPVGRLRQEAGRVVHAPELTGQQTLPLVCPTFLARQSGSHVVRVLREPGVWLPRRQRNGETSWRTPTVAAVRAILRNPASTGTLVHGKTRTPPPPGRARPPQRRLAPPAWQVMGPNRYPAYMTSETLERRQALVAANDAASAHNRRRGGPRQGAALVQGLVYGGSGGHTMVG
jgi:hypothetical protein